MNLIKVGTINVPDGEIDITDPCYNRDVWCRMTKKIVKGRYNCFIEEINYGSYSYGDDIRVGEIIISLAEKDQFVAKKVISTKRNWEKIGTIGVDAGLAGFFVNKPDFNDDEWYALCNKLAEIDKIVRNKGDYNERSVTTKINRKPTSQRTRYYFMSGDAFFSESGLGDGSYPVCAIYNESKEIVALRITF